MYKVYTRWLKENEPQASGFLRTRKDLFRLAARHGLIIDTKGLHAAGLYVITNFLSRP